MMLRSSEVSLKRVFELGNREKQHETSNGKLVLEWDELSWKFHQRRTGAQKAAT